jgi:hypothetical protein
MYAWPISKRCSLLRGSRGTEFIDQSVTSGFQFVADLGPIGISVRSTDVEMIPFPPFAGKPARFVDKKGRFVEARLKTHPASGIHL